MGQTVYRLDNPHFRRLLLSCFIFILGAIYYINSLTPTHVETLLAEAAKHYSLGVEASSSGEKEKQLNEALSIYLELEKEHDLQLSNGKFYANLATIYGQLHAEPDALLYDAKERALRAPFAESRLLQLYLSLGVIATLFASLWIWFPRKWLAALASIFFLLSVSFFASALYSKYFSPIQAIVYIESPLRQNPNNQAPLVIENPLNTGDELEILEVVQEGEWLKVETSQGKIGYLKNRTIRVI